MKTTLPGCANSSTSALMLGRKLLEVGVGQGTDLVQFAKGGAEVSGIDITQRHLELAARNFAVRHMHAKLAYATAAAIPFESDFFDVVYSFGVLHHTNDTVRCLSECHRVLKPGGRADPRAIPHIQFLSRLHDFGQWHPSRQASTTGIRGPDVID